MADVKLDFEAAAQRLKHVVKHTPLEYNAGLSETYDCNLYLKREDLQIVRSYKLRGAFNMISQLTPDELSRGIVCASAGNHAQGVAFSCNRMGIKGVIFMPEITPRQKVKQTEMFAHGHVEIILTGDTFDDCLLEALTYTRKHHMTFIPPFDNYQIIEGQGSVAVEILHDLPETDVVIMPIGGGGLAAGAGSYLKQQKPGVFLIGVEPEGAPSMLKAFEHGGPVSLPDINRFVDGAAVKTIG
ncbi:MAG: pyridoxal-phosphate dependent enzyme, partial [Mucilaginibacter sp.]